MKEVKVIIPSEKLELVKELEEKLGLVFNISIFENVVTINTTLEDQHTSTLLEELKGLGVGTVFGRITVSPISFEISSDKKESKARGRGISIDEMIANIKGLALMNPTYLGLILLAGALASFGLIYNNVIIVIASMIIAPLLGPIALAVIGTMTPKNIYSKRAIVTEILGIAFIIGFGVIVGLIYNSSDPSIILNQVPPSNPDTQIAVRILPNIGDIVVAIASGLAAGIFIVRGENTAIVGVAVAASLCPPAANVGVLLASGATIRMALGSLLLLVLNIISIYASCALIFWTSQSFVRGGTVSARQYRKISKLYIIQIAMITLILAGIVILIVLNNNYGFLEVLLFG
ncbi:MAG: TIGR00341 family protein [Candidatus Heimdallarchaeota archaeon]|nr:TIGR00341 family protein [Candidatus Heimdallarchaeota archaeon]MCG3255691.1 TIGR00341 family protein [Candidatus Heimdallarchaeota archaeon]MCK4610765.1 TIGR00341 family protein [Candidatus Heimdallarchaeota archaeon]